MRIRSRRILRSAVRGRLTARTTTKPLVIQRSAATWDLLFASRSAQFAASMPSLVIQRSAATWDLLFAPDKNYFRPSRFCATTNPRGVGNNTTEINPSLSSFSAASRTCFKCDDASCIRISPYGLICGK